MNADAFVARDAEQHGTGTEAASASNKASKPFTPLVVAAKKCLP